MTSRWPLPRWVLTLAFWTMALAVGVAASGCQDADPSADSTSADSTSTARSSSGSASADASPRANAQADPRAPSHPARIRIDGAFGDWASVPVRHRDPEGDGERIDLGRLWMAHDDRYVFLRVETGAAINLQEGNGLTLYVDADADASTGHAVGGLGAELAWTFGQREGRFFTSADVDTVYHADVGLASLPTVRSDVFEIALDRSARPDGETRLFASDTLRLALVDGTGRTDRARGNSSPGDRLPDGSGGVAYALTPAVLADFDAPTLGRTDRAALRLLSYNVERDAFFDADVRSVYTRLLRAIQPDVIAFQEVYEHDAAETGRVVASILNPSGDAAWSWAKMGLDLVAVSRYPIRDTHTIPGYADYASGAVLLDTDAVLGGPLVVVMLHPPCCTDPDARPTRDQQRQIGVDAVAAFVRELRQGTGPFDVAPQVPLVVLGDMNFVGDPQQPETIRTGAIVDTARFGASAPPDADGTPLRDVNPRQIGSPLHVTWQDPASAYPPGRLDYVYVSDAVLDVVQGYVLDTRTLDATTRAAYALEPGDTKGASDHLPLVVDVVRSASGGE